MKIIASMVFILFFLFDAASQKAIIVFLTNDETYFLELERSSGKIKKKFILNQKFQNALYHNPTQKIFLFSDNIKDSSTKTHYGIYDIESNAFEPSVINGSWEFLAYFSESDLFLAFEKQQKQLILFRFENSPKLTLNTISTYAIKEPFLSYEVNSKKGIVYFLFSKSLEKFDISNNQIQSIEAHDLNDLQSEKIIKTLSDDSAYLEHQDEYNHFDLKTNKIKDKKSGKLSVAESDKLLILSKWDKALDQNKNIFIFRNLEKSPIIRQKIVKKKPKEVLITPDNQDIYFIYDNELKIYRIETEELLNKHSFGIKHGVFKIFFID